jgi:type IX secretion system PorP/SprF family membrane protein
MRLFKLLVIILLLHIVGKTQAQEVHNSQYYAMPLYLNPANTGNSNYDFRGGLNVRNQWGAVSVPFTAQYMYGDIKLPVYFGKRSWVGLGASLLNDIAGDGIQSTYGGLSFAFHKVISRGYNLLWSNGISTQLINKSIDYREFKRVNEWGNNLSNKTGDIVNLEGKSSFFYIDLSLGTKLTYFYNKDKYSLGVSMSHINQPSESFYNLTNNLSRKLTIYASAEKWINNKSLILHPSCTIDIQDGYIYAIFGSNVFKPYNLEKTKSIVFGIWYRTTEEIIPTVGVEFTNFKLMTSYDVPISDKTYANRGGFEITLTYTLGYSDPIEQLNKFQFLKPRKRIYGAIPCPKFIE